MIDFNDTAHCLTTHAPSAMPNAKNCVQNCSVLNPF